MHLEAHKNTSPMFSPNYFSAMIKTHKKCRQEKLVCILLVLYVNLIVLEIWVQLSGNVIVELKLCIECITGASSLDTTAWMGTQIMDHYPGSYWESRVNKGSKRKTHHNLKTIIPLYIGWTHNGKNEGTEKNVQYTEHMFLGKKGENNIENNIEYR